MSNGSLSPERLGRMRGVMAGYVERGAVPGIVTLVSRRGETHVDAIGSQTIGGAPMQRDTIFRIASMTKPVTAVATMILVEECKLRLDDPVDELLPELADRQVLKQIDGPLDDTVPADRPITVRDLLAFTMGFGIIFTPPDTYPIQHAVSELQLQTLWGPKPATPHDPDEWIRRLGTLPLMHQPGEQWMYNTGSHVLGILISRASCQPLEEFFRERIFEPLGMNDTGFSAPADKLDRLATCYDFDSEAGEFTVHDGVDDNQWSNPPAFPDGAAGLVSTVDDYLAFAQMLLNIGRYGNERILSRPAVELMTTDQLTPEQKAASSTLGPLLGGRSWGLGVAVVTERTSISANPGQYGWDGGYTTSWISDPAEELVAILMCQRSYGDDFMTISPDFWTSVYQALDD